MPVPGTTLRNFRPQVQGLNGVVVSSHPSTSMASLDVLKQDLENDLRELDRNKVISSIGGSEE